MGLFPRQLLWLLVFTRKVGKLIHQIEESKIVRFLKRNRLFSLIPIAFLSWQLAVTRGELEENKSQEEFYKTRLDSYFRDWEDIQFGMWEKLKVNGFFVFLGINETYVENYLIPNGLERADVIGKRNREVVGELVGKAWHMNDSIVAYTGTQVNSIEPAKYGDSEGLVFISKWRKIRRNGDTTVIGMAIKLDTIQKLYIKHLED